MTSLVTSFWSFHSPSLKEELSLGFNLYLGVILISKLTISNNKLGLSLEYTLTKESSHLMVVNDLGSLFLISQKTALPKLTSCFISLILWSLGQHFLLLYPMIFSLFGSGFSVKYLCIKSLASSAVNLKNI